VSSERPSATATLIFIGPMRLVDCVVGTGSYTNAR
jgi:hypothetical protein